MIKLCTHISVYIEDKIKNTKIIDEMLQKVKIVITIYK